MKWNDLEFWKWVAIGFVMVLVVTTLAGCKAKYVSVPEYHTEYIVRADTIAKTDSVIVKDSVFVYNAGDTVFVNKIAYRDRYHNIYKVKCDTILKRDSVSLPYPVERELTKGEQRLMALGRLFLAFLFIVTAYIVITFFWYRNKQ